MTEVEIRRKASRGSRRTARENYFDMDSLDDAGGHGAPAPRASMLHQDFRKSLKRLDSGHQGGVFEHLQRLLGFQVASMRNQKEHVAVLLTNKQTRLHNKGSADPTRDGLKQLHSATFVNYTKWCKFLGTKPRWVGQSQEAQIALYFLIWGEAGNLRFMPECLCFLYHTMAARWEKLEALGTKPEHSPADTAFLNNVIKPIYKVVAKMNPALSGKKDAKAKDHKNVTNYDDVNEFFWSPECLRFDETNVARAFERREVKTFKERRSLLSPFLAFYRIFFFLLVMLHVLVVIAYVGVKTNNGNGSGFHIYDNFLSSTYSSLRQHAFYSIAASVAGLSALKVVLQVWIDGALIFSHKMYALALYGRLLWHSVFLAFFCCMITSPSETDMLLGKSYLTAAPLYVGAYAVPVVLAAAVSMFCNGANMPALRALQGTRSQYIGREMGQSVGDFLKYSIFWILLFGLKFVFNLQLMIMPLMNPSIELYGLSVDSNSNLLKSGHNLLFIGALWAPTFLVYIYDTQIWLAIFQAIVGMYMGFRMKIGHSSRVGQFMKKLQTAPSLFDQKVVSRVARGMMAAGADSTSPEVQARLRFSVVWNECVSSFRLSDLIDDRESAILQYQISASGQVDDPVFLLAGKTSRACDVLGTIKSPSRAKLSKELAKEGLVDVTLNAVDLGIRILSKLLGPADALLLEALTRATAHPDDTLRSANLSFVPQLRENAVDLLACLLDMPDAEDELPANARVGSQVLQDRVALVVERVEHVLATLQLIFPSDGLRQRLTACRFTQLTSDMTHQMTLLSSLFVDEETASDDGGLSESAMSYCTRLYFLLTLDIADALPRCAEAQRRMSFFLNSLAMYIPQVDAIQSMHSFSVVTPYYNEPVLYSLEELNDRVVVNPLFSAAEAKAKKEKVGREDLSILKYLITLHPEEWGNFLERLGVSSREEALMTSPTQVRLWASMRGQTLARTVHGMMLYEDAIKILRWLEIGSDQSMSHEEKIEQMDHIVGMKFSYITSCQIYAAQSAANDPRAADIDLLMRKYPNWRVSFMEQVGDDFECVLVKAEGDDIVEVYRYQLPGHPIVGEGKPENQNIALPFTRGEYIQTIDMNQEHYFEEALKMPNFLATGKGVQIIGMKEYIFTAKASSLARFMTLQELVFVSLTQRVMASPLQTRMHYGHPDVFDKLYIMTNGGVSKASKGINLSEDVFAGYSCALRGGKVTHVEFMQCGKGRDVTLSQINAFEAKLANGSAESSLSREAHRMGAGMDFFRLNAMYYSHMGFYIANFLTVVCVFVYAYCKLYVALHFDVEKAVIPVTSDLDHLAQVMNTQFIFQFGMLMTIPLVATLVVEVGIRQAVIQFCELLITLGPVFYIFETGTKAHFYDVAIQRGGSKYRGTGRGFAITRETFVNFFKEYAASHYRKALELMALMVLFGLYGTFNIGNGAKDKYCDGNGTDCEGNLPSTIANMESYSKKGQSYGVASFAVWLLVVCWFFAPFIFNTDGFDFTKTRMDVLNWFDWLGATGDKKADTWAAWWQAEADLYKPISWTSRLSYAVREFRHVLVVYYIYTYAFDLGSIYQLLAAVGGVAVALWLVGTFSRMVFGNKLRGPRGLLYLAVVIGASIGGVVAVGAIADWKGKQALSFFVALFAGLYALLQYALVLHGFCGLPIARWGLVQELGYLFDALLGLLLLLPLVVLSAIPFMHTIQTRMMYNEGFSKTLSTGGEYAASISMFTGIFGGFTHGWMMCALFSLGYMNDPKWLAINESFTNWINLNIPGSRDSREDFKKNLSLFVGLGCLAGVLLGVGLCFIAGRRTTFVLSSALTLVGVGLMFAASTATTMVTVAAMVIGAAIAMSSIAICLYNYEICTRDWKCKAVVVFVFGSALGYFVEALLLFQLNTHLLEVGWKDDDLATDMWRRHLIYGAIPTVLVLLGGVFLPQSPVWQLRRGNKKGAEATLVRLRQKHDILDELQAIHDNMYPKDPPNLAFRLLVVVLLQVMFALVSSGTLFLRVLVQYATASQGTPATPWQWYYALMAMLGLLMGFFTIDAIRRKTLLKDVLPLVSLLSVGALVLQNSLYPESKALEKAPDTPIVLSVVLFLFYFAVAYSVSTATWLCAIEVFPGGCQLRFVLVSFLVYYGALTGISVARPTFMTAHIVFAALAIALTVVLFVFGASNQRGAIQLKHEKTKEHAALKAAEEEEQQRNSRMSRSHSFLRSRAQRNSSFKDKDAYHAFESPAATTLKPRVV
ncbi:callose synthase [Achlya hypogyna]|uniref:1,3-beta-glucan synthase n=1 Tax=Achlya hypogyna TaxID=1202772 RepID=A0A1V9YLL4_ACHHY|nr:callose synthase [Achlya hypogyna]